MESHVISYAILDAAPHPHDETREVVRVQVNCTPACRGFLETVMQFEVPAAVVLPAAAGKKGKKKDETPVVVSTARDTAIRERVLWKAKTEIGMDLTKDLTADDLEDVTA